MKVWEHDLQYARVLENIGYTDFILKQPELTVKHILKRITHEKLKKRISLTYKLIKEELKGNYAKLVQEIAKEARGMDRQHHHISSAMRSGKGIRSPTKKKLRRRSEIAQEVIRGSELIPVEVTKMIHQNPQKGKPQLV